MALHFLLHDFFWTVIILLAAFILMAVAGRSLRTREHPLAEPIITAAFLLIPTWFALAVFEQFGHPDRQEQYAKIIETALGIEIIWIVLSLLKTFVLVRARSAHMRVSGLFLDLVRIALIVFGAIIVFATVWDRDVTNFLATLGIGSVVLGLALQETLGNLFAGIALVFERPFKVGDWLQVGDLIGEVVETNWRSVRILSRDQVLCVVPNSVLGREQIQNFSQPSRIVGLTRLIGFSYNDPPNKVKKILLDVLRGTHGVVFEPWPRIRAKDFSDSAVIYELRFFIRDYLDQPDIEDEFKTRVWYAARRHGLTIPFPIRSVFKTEVPPAGKNDQVTDVVAALSQISLFAPLRPNELETLARDVMVMEYGRGERIIEQGDRGDSLFILQTGTAVVTVHDDSGKEREVARFSKGDVFGEMALLTGEPRTATITADSDMSVLFVYKESIQELLRARPELAAAMAEMAEVRRAGLRDMRIAMASAEVREKVRSKTEILAEKMRLFFGLN